MKYVRAASGKNVERTRLEKRGTVGALTSEANTERRANVDYTI